MSNVTLGGNPVSLSGTFPSVGSIAPAFNLTAATLSAVQLADYVGKRVILNIFPSVDTPTCAMSVRQFNSQAAALQNTAILCISADLPFAQARFCGAEGLENVVSLSTFRSASFAVDYGVAIDSLPLQGLCARAVVVIGSDGVVLHSELVSEIKNEPDYAAALATLA